MLRVQVSVDMDGKNKWEPCFQVKGVHLPVGYYFGASAATGDLAGARTWLCLLSKALTALIVHA